MKSMTCIDKRRGLFLTQVGGSRTTEVQLRDGAVVPRQRRCQRVRHAYAVAEFVAWQIRGQSAADR